MENFNNSLFLLIAIAAIIVAYNNNLKNRLLRESLQNSATLLKQAKEALGEIKSQQILLLNTLYYLIISKNQDLDVNKLGRFELIEKLIDLDVESLNLTELSHYVEQETLTLRNNYLSKKSTENKERTSSEPTAQVFNNKIESDCTANVIQSFLGNQLINKETKDKKELRLEQIANRELILNKIIKKIRDSLDLETILKTVVVEIYSFLQLDRCVFSWYRSEAPQPHWELVQEAKNHDAASFINNCVPVVNLFNLSHTICEREIIGVVDTKNLSNPLEQDFFRSLGYSAVLFIPIHTHSGEIGLISCIHSNKPRFWSEMEFELLSAVAEQLVAAIDQAELYQQSRIATAKAQAQSDKFEQALKGLQQAQSQLIQSEKMLSLGQLVAGIAHEINNSINFISGNLTYALEYSQHLLNLTQLYTKYYPEPVEEIKVEEEKIDIDFITQDLPKIIGSMETGATRIRKTILSLRNFSRLDEAEIKAVNLHEGIDNTLLILAHRLDAKNPGRQNIQLIKDYGQLPLVHCYARALNQVFMNIISNAIEAIEDYSKKCSSEHRTNYSGTLLISTQVFNSNQVIILIGDNGSGMSPEVSKRIFDPFFTTKTVGSATGLGMSITYKIIVEQHQGEIQCISAPGQGTAILIQIPIRQHSIK